MKPFPSNLGVPVRFFLSYYRAVLLLVVDAFDEGWSSKGPWDRQWEAAFTQLQAYADKHGHCRVKRVYKSAGIGLGRWVARQRSVYQGTLKGRLSASQLWKSSWEAHGTRALRSGSTG